MGAPVIRRRVLDTHIVLFALLFTSGRLAWMRQAWQQQQLQPLVCKASANELLRVLAYPKFKLSATEQQELLAGFLPYAEVVELPVPWPSKPHGSCLAAYAEVVELPVPWPELPACRDEKDQVFLVLAHIGHADALVTGDADILALRATFPGHILTAGELASRKRGE